jgi:hypothetical protein
MIEAHDKAVEMELELGLMRLVCAWCSAVMREAAPGHEKDDVSHGICVKCLVEAKKEVVGRRAWRRAS